MVMTKKSWGWLGTGAGGDSTLGQRLPEFWARYRSCFKTQTRDGSVYARHYLSGLLRMEGNRHYSGIAREAGVEEQNLQHFMSHSPGRLRRSTARSKRK